MRAPKRFERFDFDNVFATALIGGEHKVLSSKQHVKAQSSTRSIQLLHVWVLKRRTRGCTFDPRSWLGLSPFAIQFVNFAGTKEEERLASPSTDEEIAEFFAIFRGTEHPMPRLSQTVLENFEFNAQETQHFCENAIITKN